MIVSAALERIDADAGRASIYLGGMSVGERWANSQHSLKLAPDTLSSLKMTAPLDRRRSLAAGADNLFNQHYEVVAGRPMPGINGSGGVTLSF